MLDTAGKPVKLSDYRGRTVLLAFIFTTCPGVCPLISKQMEYVQRELKAAGLFGRQAVMLSMTIDPETDSAAALAEYARQYGADPAGWRFLRESEEKTKPVLKAYDEWTKKLPKGEMDHPARVYLIDPERQHPRDLQPGLLQREAGADRHPGVGRRSRTRRREVAHGARSLDAR